MRTRAQRRLRGKGFTYETTYLKDDLAPKIIHISKGHRSSWRSYRPYLQEGEVIRPIAVTYIHKGRKP